MWPFRWRSRALQRWERAGGEQAFLGINAAGQERLLHGDPVWALLHARETGFRELWSATLYDRPVQRVVRRERLLGVPE